MYCKGLRGLVTEEQANAVTSGGYMKSTVADLWNCGAAVRNESGSISKEWQC
jgi:hypothetical protein